MVEEWTKEIPNKAGWYWNKTENGLLRIVWFRYNDWCEELEMNFPGTDYICSPQEYEGKGVWLLTPIKEPS